jgi:hypothetical protein
MQTPRQEAAVVNVRGNADTWSQSDVAGRVQRASRSSCCVVVTWTWCHTARDAHMHARLSVSFPLDACRKTNPHTALHSMIAPRPQSDLKNSILTPSPPAQHGEILAVGLLRTQPRSKATCCRRLCAVCRPRLAWQRQDCAARFRIGGRRAGPEAAAAGVARALLRAGLRDSAPCLAR